MNIPAELVEVANQCDMKGLHQEADVLTAIAEFLMQQQRNAQPPMEINIAADDQTVS